MSTRNTSRAAEAQSPSVPESVIHIGANGTSVELRPAEAGPVPDLLGRFADAIAIVQTVQHAIRDEQPEEHSALAHAAEMLWDAHSEFEHTFRRFRQAEAQAEEILGAEAGATEAGGDSCHRNDRTDNRMRAYVASVRPLKGVVYPDPVDSANHRGRALIERLALSAAGSDLPQLRLTTEQVADVLSFVASSEPVEPRGWWRDPLDRPSHLVGFYLMLAALEESLRAPDAQPSDAGTAEQAEESARTPAQRALARLMHRLDVATDKLTLVATSKRWSSPGELDAEDLGAVAIVRETSEELEELYCSLGEWVGQHGGIGAGPWVESFEAGGEEAAHR